MPEEQSWTEQWWVWALVPLAVVLAVLWLALASSSPRQPAIPATPYRPNLAGLSQLEKFIKWLELNEPVVSTVERKCLVDGSLLAMPTVDMRGNEVGGKTTDMMPIALRLGGADKREPEAGAQEWQLKTLTAPSGATYMEIDLLDAQHGKLSKAASMRSWQLAEHCPALAQVPPAEWTDDERQYVHYLTRRALGYDDVEQGFAALWAAYASNFALWHGEQRSVPAAAYYALAAAHFSAALDSGIPASPRARAVTCMLCAECLRLLGRQADAQRWLDTAQRIDAEQQTQDAGAEGRAGLHEPERQTLQLLMQLNAAGDPHLQRLPFTRIPEPPTGWLVEVMLPAINGDLDVERERWAAIAGIAELQSAINARIAQVRGR